MNLKTISFVSLVAGQVLLLTSLLKDRHSSKVDIEEFVFVGFGIGFKLILTQTYGTRGSVIDSEIVSVNADGEGSECEFVLLEQHLQQSITNIKDRKKVIEEIRYISQLCNLEVTVKG